MTCKITTMENTYELNYSGVSPQRLIEHTGEVYANGQDSCDQDVARYIPLYCGPAMNYDKLMNWTDNELQRWLRIPTTSILRKVTCTIGAPRLRTAISGRRFAPRAASRGRVKIGQRLVAATCFVWIPLTQVWLDTHNLVTVNTRGSEKWFPILGDEKLSSLRRWRQINERVPKPSVVSTRSLCDLKNSKSHIQMAVL